MKSCRLFPLCKIPLTLHMQVLPYTVKPSRICTHPEYYEATAFRYQPYSPAHTWSHIPYDYRQIENALAKRTKRQNQTDRGATGRRAEGATARARGPLEGTGREAQTRSGNSEEARRRLD